MPIFLHALTNLALLIFVVLALLGARDYIVDSWTIFERALKRYRERSRDKD